MVKYEYRDEYWKMIDKGTCPECKGMIYKNSNYYHCGGCSLEVYGDPRLVSYIEIKGVEAESEVINYNICPECGASRLDNKFRYEGKEDELVCIGCGLVLDGPQMNVVYPFKGHLLTLHQIGLVNLNMHKRTSVPQDSWSRSGNAIHHSCRR